MFKGITLQDFNNFFRDEDDCRRYLFDLKFKKEYQCRKCGHDQFWKGRTAFHARCAKCGYDESATAHSIFHKIQIPLMKAFSMAFQIVVYKKGISTIELAKLHSINQKTAWSFKRKIQEAMGMALSEDDRLFTTEKNCKLDSITVSHRVKYLNGLQRANLVIQRNTSVGSAMVLARCKGSVSDSDKIDLCNLVAGRYVDEGKDIRIWNFKGWLTGIHHHCSEKYLQGYLDEFFFRYNFRHHQKSSWHSLIQHMVRAKLRYLTAKAA